MAHGYTYACPALLTMRATVCCSAMDRLRRRSSYVILCPYHWFQAFAFGKGDDMALAYLKELRQNGTDRRTEMSKVISGEFLEYRAIKEAEEAEVSTRLPSPFS